MPTIQDIKPYPKNAKKHDKKQLELLAKIVTEVGWRQNTEVNQDGVIVAGHGRYLCWQEYKDKLNLLDEPKSKMGDLYELGSHRVL